MNNDWNHLNFHCKYLENKKTWYKTDLWFFTFVEFFSELSIQSRHISINSNKKKQILVQFYTKYIILSI